MARRILQFVEMRRALRRERVVRDRRNPLDHYDDAELVKRYRFSREGIMTITDIVAADVQHPTRRNYALLPYQQVLIALQYYATGTFQYVAGDPLQVSQQTAWRAIHRVTDSLAKKIGDYVKFPDARNIASVKDGFYWMRNNYTFPGVIGCVDGTHIWILSPHTNEVDYVNRKGYTSLNCQVIRASRFNSMVPISD